MNRPLAVLLLAASLAAPASARELDRFAGVYGLVAGPADCAPAITVTIWTVDYPRHDVVSLADEGGGFASIPDEPDYRVGDQFKIAYGRRFQAPVSYTALFKGDRLELTTARGEDAGFTCRFVRGAKSRPAAAPTAAPAKPRLAPGALRLSFAGL